MKNSTAKNNTQLLNLMNVGKAVLSDLILLGITNIDQLKDKNPDQLYEELQKLTNTKQDPCVWDVFAAIIHEAGTGEKLPWWHWSAIRKSTANHITKNSVQNYVNECMDECNKTGEKK